MQSQDLKPIPIPPKQQWREFRVVYLPILTFGFLIFLIGWMWIHYVAPSAIIGEVETVRANVISIVAGTIVDMKVDRLASVTNGQELAVISPEDPEQIKAELESAEADLRLLKTRMDVDKVRNLSSYAQLRTDLEIEKFRLEAAKIRLVQAEGEYDRTKKLLDSDLIARGSGNTRNNFGFDVVVRDRDELKAEVAAREKTVATLQDDIKRLETAGATEVDPQNIAIEQAIAAERERLVRLRGPIVLRSPINGFVSVINHVLGSKVTAGQNILVVSAEKSSRIVAWVRQPVGERPNIGDTVEVRRARLGYPAFQATIVKVGKQLEEINPTAVPLSTAIQRAEFGLPLIVQVNDKEDLIPGEAVQIRVIKRAATQTN